MEPLIKIVPGVMIGAERLCRWCGEIRVFVDRKCPDCRAIQSAFFVFQSGLDKQQIHVFINPDNSIWLEFEQPDGKTARFVFDPKILLAEGKLRFFDSPPHGRR